MSKLIDLTGNRYFRLVVLYRTNNKIYNRKNKKVSKVCWHCKCDCGNEVDVIGESLKQGLTKSCGCWNYEQMCNPEIKNHSSLFDDWRKDNEYYWLYERYRSILKRCGYIGNQSNKNYSERGINICSSWLNNYLEFKEWSLKNNASKDLTIDRIDVNGDYEPYNCRWVTNKVQQRNKRNTMKLEYNNKIQSLADWAEEYNISYRLLKERLKRGWSVEKALLTELKKCK